MGFNFDVVTIGLLILAALGVLLAVVPPLRERFWRWHPSIYLALIGWGCTAFTAQPYFASLFVHFFIFPIFLALTVFFARHEGMSKERSGQRR